MHAFSSILLSAELEEAHNYDTTISYLRHSGNSINLCAEGESTEATYEIEIEELQKPWRSFFLPELSPRPKEEENTMEEKESWESELLEPRKELHPSRPPKEHTLKTRMQEQGTELAVSPSSALPVVCV